RSTSPRRPRPPRRAWSGCARRSRTCAGRSRRCGTAGTGWWCPDPVPLVDRSAVDVDGVDQLFERLLGLVVLDLAGAGVLVPAAGVLEAEVPDVGLGAAVQDRLADRERGVHLLQAPQHVDRDVALRVERVDHEPVPGEDGLLVAQV